MWQLEQRDLTRRRGSSSPSQGLLPRQAGHLYFIDVQSPATLPPPSPPPPSPSHCRWTQTSHSSHWIIGRLALSRSFPAEDLAEERRHATMQIGQYSRRLRTRVHALQRGADEGEGISVVEEEGEESVGMAVGEEGVEWELLVVGQAAAAPSTASTASPPFAAPSPSPAPDASTSPCHGSDCPAMLLNSQRNLVTTAPLRGSRLSAHMRHPAAASPPSSPSSKSTTLPLRPVHPFALLLILAAPASVPGPPPSFASALFLTCS
jgi:hypothetical protein